MSDLFFFRDAIEPEGIGSLQSRTGGGAGEEVGDEFVGFHVEATDGSIGRVLDVERAPGHSHLVIQTGGTILSKKVVIPAAMVDTVDRDDKKVHLSLTKDEVRDAPEFDEEDFRAGAHRDEVTNYYAPVDGPRRGTSSQRRDARGIGRQRTLHHWSD